jgi:hypothetical protein
MSNIHHLHQEAPAAAPIKARKPREKKISEAEIKRVLLTAHNIGLTIYGFTIEGGQIKVQTKPDQVTAKGAASEVDAWFNRRG